MELVSQVVAGLLAEIGGIIDGVDGNVSEQLSVWPLVA